jgi:tetratricopeptide (TPR) repeat protein
MTPEDTGELAFRIVASQKTEGRLGGKEILSDKEHRALYYAEKVQNGPLYVQPLNANDCPAGEKRFLTLDFFVAQFTPEPFYYYNKVKPLVDALEKNLERGESALRNQQYEKAEDAYKQVLELDEENIQGNFGLGLAYLGAGKENEARMILGKLMDLELAFTPEHKHMFNRFGIRMRKNKMYAEAEAYYKKAITLNPDDEHLYFNLARVYFDTNVVKACHQNLVDALDLNPTFQEGIDFLKYIVANHEELQPAGSVVAVAETIPDSVRYPDLDLDGAPWLV